MGIILLFAFIISVISTVKIVKLILKKSIDLTYCLYGLLLSSVIFGIISLSYLIEGKAYAFSPMFRTVLFMIIVPYGVYSLLNGFSNDKVILFSKVVLLSILFSTISLVVFYGLGFDLFDILEVEKYH